MTDNKDTKKFYDDALNYWSQIDPSINGMLGGFAQISSTDIAGSSKFLRNFIKGDESIGVERALDCGAGIGRTTKRLLLPLFKVVDMVEFNEKFLDESSEYIGELMNNRVGSKYCTPLQSFSPGANLYNLIWIQWVLGHLTEPDFIAFFRRCKEGLSDNGLICVKENVAPTETPIFDAVDSSYTRSYTSLTGLFTAAGLTLVSKQKQIGFPKDIYDVWIFALR